MLCIQEYKVAFTLNIGDMGSVHEQDNGSSYIEPVILKYNIFLDICALSTGEVPSIAAVVCARANSSNSRLKPLHAKAVSRNVLSAIRTGIDNKITTIRDV